MIGRVIEAREKQGVSKRELSEISGIKQPAIVRMEKCQSTPRIDMLLKILIPLGYPLDIVPLQNIENNM